MVGGGGGGLRNQSQVYIPGLTLALTVPHPGKTDRQVRSVTSSQLSPLSSLLSPDNKFNLYQGRKQL